MSFVQNAMSVLQTNPMLASLIGLSGAGVLTFWLKDVPRMFFNLMKREFTTELTITSSNRIFHEFLKWIEVKYKNKNFRKIKLTNGQWGYNRETTISIGYGAHWIIYKGTLFLVSLHKESSNQTERDKETFSILKIGRSRKVFDELVKEIESMDVDLTTTKIYEMDSDWSYVKSQKKRKFDSIFIEAEKKNELLTSLHNFIESEQWYLDHGIPYQFGILLYGAPGTGKTSIIKAIASDLNYPIYYLSPKKLSSIESAMSSLPDKCVVVIEDIDASFLTQARSANNDCAGDEKLMKELTGTGLSEILNALDGMFSAHGRILIATTNHVETLDEALIRPGRIDLKIEIGFITKEILVDFINVFYPDYKIEECNAPLKNNITVAILQNFVLCNWSAQEIIDYCYEELG